MSQLVFLQHFFFFHFFDGYNFTCLLPFTNTNLSKRSSSYNFYRFKIFWTQFLTPFIIHRTCSESAHFLLKLLFMLFPSTHLQLVQCNSLNLKVVSKVNVNFEFKQVKQHIFLSYNYLLSIYSLQASVLSLILLDILK